MPNKGINKNKFTGKSTTGKRKSKRGNYNGAMQLFKEINPMATSSRVLCSETIQIRSTNASPEIQFSNGQLYYNINNIYAYSDFSNQIPNYYFARILNITVEMTRSCDETTMYNNTHGSNLFFGYYPTTSTNPVYSYVSRNQSFYKIDTMTFEKQVVRIKLPDIYQTVTDAGVDYSFSMRKSLQTSFFDFCPGEFVIATDNTTNNNSVVPLFTLLIKFDVLFSFRL